MKSTLLSILDYTPCLSCGRLLVHKFHLCLGCYNYIFSSSSKLKDHIDFKAYYFFSTMKPEDSSESRDVVEKLILQLKSCSDSKRFKFFSELCFNDEILHSRIAELKMPVVLYPPTTRFGNHARAMSEALAKKFKLQSAEAFTADPKQKKTKFSDKQERQRMQLSLKKGFACQKDLHYIVVDDLQTTGSTLKACYIALGSPKNFIGITLAHRLSAVENLSLV